MVAVPPWPTNILHDTKNPLTGAGDEEEAKEAPRISDPAPPGPASTEDAVAVLAAAFCFVFFSYVVLAREDAPFARESAYFFDESKTGNPNTVAGGLSLIVCTVAAFAGAYGSLNLAWVRRRRSLEEDDVVAKGRRAAGAVDAAGRRVVSRRRARAGPRRGVTPRRRAARAARRGPGGPGRTCPRGRRDRPARAVEQTLVHVDMIER